MRSTEEKCAIIETPIEASFLAEFNKNEDHTEWLAKIHDKYGEKVQNLAYPLVLERIIGALADRNRSDETFEFIDKYMRYYDEYSMHNVLDVPLHNEDTLIGSWPMYIHGHDKQGHPVFYDDLISVDLPQLIQIFSDAVHDEAEDEIEQGEAGQSNEDRENKQMLDLLKMFRIKFYAKLSKVKQEQSKKYKTTIFKHILVMDMSQFSYWEMASNLSIYRTLCKSIIADEQLLYPETLYRLYLINCPWSFSMIWKLVSTFIDPLTLQKIRVLGNDYLEEMVKDIDIDQIPAKYSGTGIAITDEEEEESDATI